MSGIATAIVGSAVIGAVSANNAARRQANAIARGQRNAISSEERMFQQGREDTAPWRAAGTQALGDLTQLYGGDMSKFFTSPQYQFTLQEGQKALDNTAAARGGALSGNQIRGQTAFAGSLASGEMQNYVSNLMGLAGLGQGSSNTSAALAGQSGNNMANIYLGSANARASAYGQGAANVNNAIQGGLQNWVLNNYLNRLPVQSGTSSVMFPK